MCWSKYYLRWQVSKWCKRCIPLTYVWFGESAIVSIPAAFFQLSKGLHEDVRGVTSGAPAWLQRAYPKSSRWVAFYPKWRWENYLLSLRLVQKFKTWIFIFPWTQNYYLLVSNQPKAHDLKDNLFPQTSLFGYQCINFVYCTSVWRGKS